MASSQVTEAFRHYIEDKACVSLAELQYNMKITYSETKELLNLAKKLKWITDRPDGKFDVHGTKPPITTFGEAKCKRLSRLMNKEKLIVLENVVERGRLLRSEVGGLLDKNSVMPLLASAVVSFLKRYELIFEINDVLYPACDMESLERIKRLYHEDED